MDKLNNVEVFYKNEFISINAKRLKLQLKAEDLYPKDYDLNSLFISFEKRKLEKDIRCPLEYGLEIFGGKWNSRIICLLAANETLRYTGLRKEWGTLPMLFLLQLLNR